MRLFLLGIFDWTDLKKRTMPAFLSILAICFSVSLKPICFSSMIGKISQDTDTTICRMRETSDSPVHVQSQSKVLWDESVHASQDLSGKEKKL